MKRLHYLLCCVFAALLMGCSSNVEDSTKKKDKEDSSEKVITGSANDITSRGALLTGKVLVDIESYSKVEFGILLSTSKNEVLEGRGTEFLGDFLKWKKFEVNTTSLTSATKYYYRAYLLLNGMQYEFGAVKEFTTLSIKLPIDIPTTVTMDTIPIMSKEDSIKRALKIKQQIKDYIRSQSGHNQTY